MADTKISNLTELTVPPDPTDELVVVDKSDTTMAASGTDKRIQYSNLYDWAEAGDLSVIEPDDAAAAGTSVEHARADHQHAIATDTAATISGTNAEGSATSFARSDHNHALPTLGFTSAYVPLAAPAATATGVNNTWYGLAQVIHSQTTITGVQFKNGGTVSTACRVYLYDAAFTQVAAKTTDTTTASANARQRVPFDGTYSASPGLYYALVWWASSTATAFMAPVLGLANSGTDATPNDIVFIPGNMAATNVPICNLY